MQPTVEAFFLVHSPSKSLTESNSESEEQTEVQEDPLSHLTQPSSSDAVKSSAVILPDQQKFLQFAGNYS